MPSFYEYEGSTRSLWKTGEEAQRIKKKNSSSPPCTDKHFSLLLCVFLYVLNNTYHTYILCCAHFNSDDPATRINRKIWGKHRVKRARWHENTQVNSWVVLQIYMGKHLSVTQSIKFICLAGSTAGANFSKWCMTPTLATSWGCLYPFSQHRLGA